MIEARLAPASSPLADTEIGVASAEGSGLVSAREAVCWASANSEDVGGPFESIAMAESLVDAGGVEGERDDGGAGIALQSEGGGKED